MALKDEEIEDINIEEDEDKEEREPLPGRK